MSRRARGQTGEGGGDFNLNEWEIENMMWYKQYVYIQLIADVVLYFEMETEKPSSCKCIQIQAPNSSRMSLNKISKKKFLSLSSKVFNYCIYNLHVQ